MRQDPKVITALLEDDGWQPTAWCQGQGSRELASPYTPALEQT